MHLVGPFVCLASASPGAHSCPTPLFQSLGVLCPLNLGLIMGGPALESPSHPHSGCLCSAPLSTRCVLRVWVMKKTDMSQHSAPHFPPLPSMYRFGQSFSLLSVIGTVERARAEARQSWLYVLVSEVSCCKIGGRASASLGLCTVGLRAGPVGRLGLQELDPH